MRFQSCRTLAALALAACASACATVEGVRQTVSIDSDPRGAEVYLGDEPQPIGKTPMFYGLWRQPKRPLRFVSPSGAEQGQVLACDYRLTLELLGNGALTLLAPAVGLGGFALDYVTGAAYDCPTQIWARLPRGPRAAPDVTYCRRYVVAPPHHADGILSDELVEMWRAKAIFKLRGCDHVLAYARSKTVFERFHWDHLRPPVPIGSVPPEKLAAIGVETGATHLVTLRAEPRGGRMLVSAEILDLHRRQVESEPQTSFVSDDARRFEVGGRRRMLLGVFGLVPSSITFGGASQQRAVQAEAPYRIVRDRSSPGPIQYVSEFGLVSVDHPDAFATWDFALKMFPSFQLAHHDREMTLRRDDPATGTYADSERDVLVLYVLPTYNGGAAFHTPVGAFSASLGIGPALKRLQVSGRPTRVSGDWAMTSELLHTCFLTSNMFVQLGATHTSFQGSALGNDLVRLERAHTTGIARFGYFFPQLAYGMRRLW